VEFDSIREELLASVSKRVSQGVRVAGVGYTDVLQKRRKLVIANLQRTKSSTAASRIQALPPSATHVFGDNVQKIKESLKLTQLIKQRVKETALFG
jgi:hypothetical protein